MKNMNPEKECTRSVESDGIRNINEEERSVELSFSSDAEVDMGWYTEILEHKAGSVDLKRLKTSGCLLYNHNRDKVIGRLENIRVEDGKCRCKAIFDKDKDSEVIWQKVLSKTLRNTSVSYRRHKMERKTEESGGEVTKVTYITKRWEPLEVSIVSVPADTSVGVGRNLNETNTALSICKRRLQINKNMLRRWENE